MLIAMATAACRSPRKDLIFDPYPTVVDPKNPNELALHPKVCSVWSQTPGEIIQENPVKDFKTVNGGVFFDRPSTCMISGIRQNSGLSSVRILKVGGTEVSSTVNLGRVETSLHCMLCCTIVAACYSCSRCMSRHKVHVCPTSTMKKP